MQSLIKRFFSLIAITILAQTPTACNADACNVVTPTFFNRSQVPGTMYKLVGMEGHTHLSDMQYIWGTSNAALQYTRSYHPTRIAHCLFGDDLMMKSEKRVSSDSSKPNEITTTTTYIPDCQRGNTIVIQGNCVQGRNNNAWLADYFYLPTDYQGAITFNPHISNINIPLDVYLGLDQWVRNIYIRTYGSIVRTQWQLDPCQTITDSGTNCHPAGYFTQNALANDQLLKSALDFFTGKTISASEADQNIVFESLQFARISRDAQTKIGFADLTIELGWDVINEWDYHLGFGFLCKAPTGSRRQADYAFSPVVGNGKHWEVGGVITGHYTFWRSCDDAKYVGVHIDTNLTHILPAYEQLTFDLKCKPNSRYLLAQRMTKTITNNVSGVSAVGTDPITQATAANKQFDGVYAPIANLTTFNTDVSYRIHADVSAKVNYTTYNWSFDLGYNFWHRSCAEIVIDECAGKANRLINECWVLKGNQRNYGYAIPLGTDDSLDPNTPVALSASQYNATIHHGTNPENNAGTVQCLSNNNTNINNPQIAAARADDSADFQPLSRVKNPTVDTELINTSIQAIALTINDIDFVEQRGISHRVFGHINYTWDSPCWAPYVGVGAYAEFGKTDSHIPHSYDTNCVDCALSQWALWVKFGLSWD